MNSYTHPFPPIIDHHTRILFLGSFPSIASFEDSFYYAHKRNAFWPIMETIFQIALLNNEAKIAFCSTHKIGLWDVIGACERENSSDSNLKGIVPNDFDALLQTYPNIVAIGFTGKKAYELFEKYFKHMSIEKVLLPSTSPAHASMTREDKAEFYTAFIEKHLTV